MTERFQRAALLAESARLEHHIQDQQSLTDRQLAESQDRGISAVVERLDDRAKQLEKCRSLANELRMQLWDLD
jgi:hypothetical protein